MVSKEHIFNPELLKHDGGLEIINVGFDHNTFPARGGTDNFRFHTFFVNIPNIETNFVSFSEISGLDIPIGQQTGKLGDISLLIDRGQDETYAAYFTRFFPFTPWALEHYPWLIGHGIATKIELNIALNLKEILGSSTTINHSHPNTLREAQLTKLGIEKRTAYPIETYIAILSAGIDFHKK